MIIKTQINPNFFFSRKERLKDSSIPSYLGHCLHNVFSMVGVISCVSLMLESTHTFYGPLVTSHQSTFEKGKSTPLLLKRTSQSSKKFSTIHLVFFWKRFRVEVLEFSCLHLRFVNFLWYLFKVLKSYLVSTLRVLESLLGSNWGSWIFYIFQLRVLNLLESPPVFSWDSWIFKSLVEVCESSSISSWGSWIILSFKLTFLNLLQSPVRVLKSF